ncbi:hypothetical protein M5D96_006956, partial [Drosophila gunungcola]
KNVQHIGSLLLVSIVMNRVIIIFGASVLVAFLVCSEAPFVK